MSKDLKTIYNRCAYSPRELQNFVNDVIDGTISGTGLPSIEDGDEGKILSIDKNKNLKWYSISELINITYSELVSLKNQSKLIPGTKYRITDYTCTTTQQNTSSAGHQFDIIVFANSISTLSEDAKAIKHEGDTYFNNSNLDNWELKYCLDNDIDRFAWADSENGKGVIFWMKDEWENEAPYDFKNILMSGSIQNTSFQNVYTFHNSYVGDASLNKGTYRVYAHDNKIKTYRYNNKDTLPFIIWKSSDNQAYCYDNLIEGNSSHVLFTYNTTNNYLYGRVANSLFYNCIKNIFVKNSNTYNSYFQTICMVTIGGRENYNLNILVNSNGCGGANIENSHDINLNIGIGSNVTIKNSAFINMSNNFNNINIDDCNYINFGTDSSNLISYCRNIVIEPGCAYINLYSLDTDAKITNYLQNIHIYPDVKGTNNNYLNIEVSDRNLKYLTEYKNLGSTEILL